MSAVSDFNFMSKEWPKSVRIFTDGASRGNPGPASIGVYILHQENEEVVAKLGEYLGERTNNFAEYRAVVRAFEISFSAGAQELAFFSDSQLLVQQLNGVYKVKSENIRPLFEECQIWQKKFQKVTYTHVRREFNKESDRLANLALDAQYFSS